MLYDQLISNLCYERWFIIFTLILFSFVSLQKNEKKLVRYLSGNGKNQTGKDIQLKGLIKLKCRTPSPQNSKAWMGSFSIYSFLIQNFCIPYFGFRFFGDRGFEIWGFGIWVISFWDFRIWNLGLRILTCGLKKIEVLHVAQLQCSFSLS